MPTKLKRATIYLPPEIHRALRIKAAVAERSISDLVSEAVKESLTEDAIDLAAFKERENEPDLDFEDVLKALRKRRKL